MDIRKVKKLIELLEESNVAEIEIHEGEESVRLSKQSPGDKVQTVVHVPNTPGNTDTMTAKNLQSRQDDSTEMTGNLITSPMVGIYYESSTPGGHPFVEVGQTVAKGDILCIIEAMKIMNQIESDVSGEIKKIFVENGEPVEFGQPLFQII